MVLVDTSVWVRFLANQHPYRPELDRLLALNQVTAHELVYGELVMGDTGGRRNLLDAYERLRPVRTVPHWQVVEFVQARNLKGRGGGWIDIHLLASALVGRLQLWTADPRFAAVATELGVAYEASGPAGTVS
ncbi:MAG TPA: PIN domain-containing protein [Bryobacteraceae bacterium]|nr:PIN domain-containing protein [Bryobacteraceae bacterium]